MKFHAHLDGYSRTFDSLTDLRTWVSGLVAKHPDLTGKTLTIHQAVKVFTAGKASAAVYSGQPSHRRQIVIGA